MRGDEDDVPDDGDATCDCDGRAALVDPVRGPAEDEDGEEREGVDGDCQELGSPRRVAQLGDDGWQEEREGVCGAREMGGAEEVRAGEDLGRSRSAQPSSLDASRLLKRSDAQRPKAKQWNSHPYAWTNGSLKASPVSRGAGQRGESTRNTFATRTRRRRTDALPRERFLISRAAVESQSRDEDGALTFGQELPFVGRGSGQVASDGEGELKGVIGRRTLARLGDAGIHQ